MEGVYIFRLVYLAITTICFVSFSLALFVRRHNFLISNRVPVFIFIFNIWSIIQNAILLVPWTPCYLVNFTSWLALPFQLNSCLFILLQARVQQQLKQKLQMEKSASTSKCGTKLTKRNLYIAYIFGAIFFILLSIVQAAYVKDFLSNENETTKTKCSAFRDDGFRFLFEVIYFILFIAVTVFLRRVNERLHIKRELLIIGIVGLVYLVYVFVVAFTLPLDDQTQQAALWIGSATASAVACVISGIIPLRHLGSEDNRTTDLSDIAVTSGDASPVDSRGNSLNFLELINDDTEGIPFQEFLQKEFSLENLLFIKAVHRFKEIEKEPDLLEQAKKIHRNFIGGRSRTQVNIAGAITDLITQQLSTGNIDKTLFDSAYQQVFELLKYGAFPRFLKSLTEQ